MPGQIGHYFRTCGSHKLLTVIFINEVLASFLIKVFNHQIVGTDTSLYSFVQSFLEKKVFKQLLFEHNRTSTRKFSSTGCN